MTAGAENWSILQHETWRIPQRQRERLNMSRNRRTCAEFARMRNCRSTTRLNITSARRGLRAQKSAPRVVRNTQRGSNADGAEVKCQPDLLKCGLFCLIAFYYCHFYVFGFPGFRLIGRRLKPGLTSKSKPSLSHLISNVTPMFKNQGNQIHGETVSRSMVHLSAPSGRPPWGGFPKPLLLLEGSLREEPAPEFGLEWMAAHEIIVKWKLAWSRNLYMSLCQSAWDYIGIKLMCSNWNDLMSY